MTLHIAAQTGRSGHQRRVYVPPIVLVSILTRPYGRMLCRRQRSTAPVIRCFNPHPPLRADAMEKRFRIAVATEVSILTRPYGRMLSGSSSKMGESCVFQSSPALTGGCYFVRSSMGSNLCEFQSSPALTGGCYNALQHVGYDGQFSVSILTRPYGRML